MPNLMDSSGFDGSRQPIPDFQSALNQAMQNPQAFSQMSVIMASTSGVNSV